MPCDTKLRKGQTIQQRASEIKEMVSFVDELIRKNRVKVIVDKKTGAVAFAGMTDQEKVGATDACIYRRLLATGSVLAKQAIARAEQLAGRTVSREALTQGWHSHNSGRTFSTHKH